VKETRDTLVEKKGPAAREGQGARPDHSGTVVSGCSPFPKIDRIDDLDPHHVLGLSFDEGEQGVGEVAGRGLCRVF